MDNLTINVLVLAYLGDSIYEFHIRDYLIKKKIGNVKDLQKEAIQYVSAKAQCSILKKMLEEQFLTENEIDIVMRARNHKVAHRPKSTDIVTYKYATGLEALIGYLYLEKKEDRILEIMNYVIGE